MTTGYDAVPSPEDLADLTPGERARARALTLVNEYALWLRHDRQLDPAAIGAAMAMVGVANLKIDPRDPFDTALAQALLDALRAIVEPPVERKH